MTMLPRPARAELEQLATLISGQAEDRPVAEPVSLQKLDYHGIAMLALQTEGVSAELQSSLQKRQRLMVANEALKRQALLELANSLHAAGLRPLVFKGTALAYLSYQQAWHRPRTDTDLLIDETEFDKYVTTFESLGYARLFAIEGKMVSYQCTFGKKLGAQSALNIDLHWRISNRQLLANKLNYAELNERAVPIAELGLAAVSRVDALLIACLHRLGHHWREERLVWIYDIYLLANALNKNEWSTLCNLAQDKALCALTLDGLHYAKSLFNLTVPQIVETRLSNSGKEPSAVFLRRDLPDWRLAWHELRAIPGVWQKYVWLLENLLPPNAYVKRQMQVDSALLAHLLRIRRGFGKLLNSRPSR